MLILAVLGIAGAIYHYTRPATLARLILPRASEAIGGDVRAGRIAFGGLSTIVLSDLSIRAPGWDGLAGEVLVSNRIEINFSIPRLLFGDFNLRSVHVDKLRLRLVESNDKLGQFSILALDPKPTDAKGGALSPFQAFMTVKMPSAAMPGVMVRVMAAPMVAVGACRSGRRANSRLRYV